MELNSNDKVIYNGEKYTLVDVISAASIDNILFDYEKEHPDVLNKSLKLFKMFKYQNISIEHTYRCLYGEEHDFNPATKSKAMQLRTYTLWHYNKIEINLEDKTHLDTINYVTEFLPRKLKRQPFKSYYVRLNYQHFYGFFVSKGFYLNGNNFISSHDSLYDSNELCLSLVFYNDSGDVFHSNFNINLLQSGDLKQILKNAWYNFMEISPLQLEKSYKDAIDQILEIALFAINVMYYIHDINSAKPEVFQSVINQHKQPKADETPKDSIHKKEYERKLITSNCNATVIDMTTVCHHNSSEKSPHVRRGHWHHYWVGKKGSDERRRVLKWVEDITVKCNDRHNLPNVKIKL